MKFSQFFILPCAIFAMSVIVGCAGTTKNLNPEELAAQSADTHAKFQDLIANVVDDPIRAKEFSELSAQRDRLIRKHANTVQQYSKILKQLNLDYSTGREEFENVIRDYNQERRSAQVEFLALMDKMKATVTEKEWEKLATFELKNLNPRTMDYPAGDH